MALSICNNFLTASVSYYPSAKTKTIVPPGNPTYNPELAVVLNKSLSTKTSPPATTTLSNHFFGKFSTSSVESMAPVDGEEMTSNSSKLTQSNPQLASKPATTTSTANAAVGEAVAASSFLPKTAIAKPRTSAIAPVGSTVSGLPKVVPYAPLPGLGQTVNGEFVNTPGRYQGYGSRIPYASFVADFVKPAPQVEYENVPGRYQGYGSRIPYTSFCSRYPGPVFTVKGESDYAVKAHSNRTE